MEAFEYNEVMKSMKNFKLTIVPPCMVFYIDIYSGVFLGPPCTDMDMMLVLLRYLNNLDVLFVVICHLIRQ